MIRFGKKGKLNPRYIGPYKILKRVVKVAYELDVPTKLVVIDPIFHISLLKNCMGLDVDLILVGMKYVK